MYFAGFYLPLNPSATTVYARSAFYPSLRFTLSLQSAVCILHSVCILPLVRSLQSAGRSLRFTLTGQDSTAFRERSYKEQSTY